MESIKIIKEPSADKPFLIIDKPKYLPTAPLSPDDKNNALFMAAELYPEIMQVEGKKSIEYGLIHRIDTITDGLVLIAVNQKTYDYLTKLQAENKIIKTYKAKCRIDYENAALLEGFPPARKINLDFQKQFSAESYFRAFGKGKKEVRPVTIESGEAALKKIGKPKLYSTKITIISKGNNIAEVECEITNGYRHQVRCHLAWNNLPIINDPLYNFKNKNTGNPIEFSAFKLNINGEVYTRKET